ncbi:superoxide reductase [Dissulfurirhabdus thermomarina]|uniref:Superoxide reductase n=1 Tax=Dissulfurirhabdus thermomarina TaxID=1765737 RepID=A0A6N9TT00_DISTH|nr:desulfoferrodoxin family protein [Dissulfurirhabdus thermomarina]NDY43213.1 superoxide reductase [Dissulfurirhabdus thermomarina]NMX23931.1 superoxide reductase [Dissulfurirhabdus thermomarina]
MKRREFLVGTAAAVLAAAGAGRAGAGAPPEAVEGLRRLSDPHSPSVLEQKHVPGIEAPARVKAGDWFDVKVRVGYRVTHPSAAKHWITWIALRVDGAEVGRVTYPVGGVAAPEARFRIRIDRPARLEAVEHCNLHGTWIGEPVEVAAA